MTMDSTGRRMPVRHVDAGEFFESFIVAAVAAVLAIRIILRWTGWPRLGGETLHIAHMLWGGLLMLVAIVLLVAFLGKGVRTTAAVIGGIGFGAFIDELGKFVTADNDYFYQPAFALIYVLFITLYLVFRAIQRPRLTQLERLANALEITHEAVRHDLDIDERRRALELIGPASTSDPVGRALHAALDAMTASEPRRASRLTRLRSAIRSAHRWLVGRWWFVRSVVAATVILALINYASMIRVLPGLENALLLAAVATALAALWIRSRPAVRSAGAMVLAGALGAVLATLAWVIATSGMMPHLSFLQWGEFASALVPAGIVLAGIYQLPGSRRTAFGTFRIATLFQIFVTRFFLFYQTQLGAVVGLAIDVLVLVTLRQLIRQEDQLLRERQAGPAA
ncbi:MAG: hypothetical protein L0271_25380 [Gemmatimonadetes bacterium]|nr:hypothetical protein [Gemmatimonadota bacterium]